MNLFSIGFGIGFQHLRESGYEFLRTQTIVPISSSDLHLLLFSQKITKFISNLSVHQNLSHIPPIIFQDQNNPFLLHDLLLFYPTNMKRDGNNWNWSHFSISQEWISSSFHQHLCILNLIPKWCFNERSPSILNEIKSHNWW